LGLIVFWKFLPKEVYQQKLWSICLLARANLWVKNELNWLFQFVLVFSLSCICKQWLLHVATAIQYGLQRCSFVHHTACPFMSFPKKLPRLYKHLHITILSSFILRGFIERAALLFVPPSSASVLSTFLLPFYALPKLMFPHILISISQRRSFKWMSLY